MRKIFVVAAVLLLFSGASHAGEDGVMAGMSTVCPPDALEGRSVAEAAGEDQAREAGLREKAEYYNRELVAVSGKVAAMDEGLSTITIKLKDGSTQDFSYDARTIFQVMLKPAGPGAVKKGSTVAGLYMDGDGGPCLTRLMVLSR